MAHGAGLLLLSAVAGYWVLERAATHKGNLKSIGQFLGSVIIIASLVGLALKAWCLVSSCQSATPMGGRCPFMSKVAPPATSSK